LINGVSLSFIIQYCFNLKKTDIIATEAHGNTRKKVFYGLYSSVFFRVLPWLLNKSAAQLN